jgi:hypothetical protein
MRSCLGRKSVHPSIGNLIFRLQLCSRFFETEAIAILTVLLKEWKVSVKKDPQFANETVEQSRERYTRSKPFITLT